MGLWWVYSISFGCSCKFVSKSTNVNNLKSVLLFPLLHLWLHSPTVCVDVCGLFEKHVLPQVSYVFSHLSFLLIYLCLTPCLSEHGQNKRLKPGTSDVCQLPVCMLCRLTTVCFHMCGSPNVVCLLGLIWSPTWQLSGFCYPTPTLFVYISAAMAGWLEQWWSYVSAVSMLLHMLIRMHILVSVHVYEINRCRKFTSFHSRSVKEEKWSIEIVILI